MPERDHEITEEVVNIVSMIKKIDKDKVLTYINEPITGRKLNFNEIDMVYLFLEICTKFGIRIKREDVESYKFNSIKNIVEIIKSKTTTGDCKSRNNNVLEKK